MPYEITLNEVPAGYALSSARSEETVKVSVSEFVSSEDGFLFNQRLEGFPSTIISQLAKQTELRPSQVDHMLAIVGLDKKCKVYVNELEIRAEMQGKRSIRAGELVTHDDIADIRRVQFEGVDLPNDCGVMFLFSIGWRKGLYYDFWPLQHGDNRRVRTTNLELLFGQLFTHVIFQDHFRVTDQEWSRLIEKSWFPFISLSRGIVASLVGHVRNDWDPDELVDKIDVEVKSRLDDWLAKWERAQYLKGHIGFIKSAVALHRCGDYPGAVAILFPRLEGILREHHLERKLSGKITQQVLAEAALSGIDPATNPRLLMFPEKFGLYLRKVFFANFDGQNPKGVSRNTVSHGVVRDSEIGAKHSLIGFLVLDQLTYYMRPQVATNPPPSSSGVSP